MKYTLILVILAACSSCSPMVYNPDNPGVPNLDKVDEGVYRSGQISSDAGWSTIAKLANKRRVHVIKLNFDNEGTDDPLALNHGFEVLNLPIQPQGDQDIWDDVKGLFMQPDPVKVGIAVDYLCWCKNHSDTDFCLGHCTHGQDRTGLIFGEYRVKCDGWTKDRAYQEMLSHHFHWEIRGLSETWEDFKP